MRPHHSLFAILALLVSCDAPIRRRRLRPFRSTLAVPPTLVKAGLDDG